MSRTERVIKGTLVSFLQYGLQIALQVALAPLVLHIAGQETLGAYAVLMQAIGYLALVDLGFSVALGRYLAQAYGQEDRGQRFRNIFTTGRTFLLGSNTVFSILTLLLAVWLKELFSLTASVAIEARWGLLLFAIWGVVRTPWVIFNGALIATQDLVAANLIGIVGNAGRLLFSLGLVAGGMGLIGLMLANILAEAITLAIYTLRFSHLHPEWKPGWGIPDRALFQSMLGFGVQALLINIAVRLVLYTDNIVVGYLYGAAAASIYYTTQMPATIGYVVFNMLTDNATPAINELFARGDQAALRRAFFSLTRYTLLLVTPLIVGLLLLNGTLISLWIGPEQYAGDLMTVALAALTFLITVGHVSNAFVMATGRIRILSILGVTEGFINLALSIWLGRLIGLPGVMLATVIANIMTTSYLQWRAIRDLDIRISEYLAVCFLPAIPPGLISYGAATILSKFLPTGAWTTFLSVGSTLVTIYAGSAYFLSLRNSERKTITNYIRPVNIFL